MPFHPALAIARRALGGSSPPWFVKNEARNMTRIGPLHSGVAGRTDHLPISVPAGSHVIPADVVSGLGQGNTNAGMKVLQNMFSTGPYGMATPRIGGRASRPPSLRLPRIGRASGGEVPDVPIMAAGGEFVVSPEAVAAWGDGNPDMGHEVIDKFILDTRAKTISTMKSLPGPVKE